MSGKREYGDYQTPIDFAEKVCHYLKDFRHIEPSAIIDIKTPRLIQFNYSYSRFAA